MVKKMATSGSIHQVNLKKKDSEVLGPDVVGGGGNEDLRHLKGNREF